MTAASTPKGERRQALLVQAAMELLVEGGFDAVRHRAVADRAGLPLASTTYYFRSLEDLLTAAVERLGNIELERGREQLREFSGENSDEEVLIKLLLELLLGPTHSDPVVDAERVLLRYERLVATGRRPYLRQVMSSFGDDLHILLGEILARFGKTSEELPTGRLLALIDGTVVNAFTADKEPREAAIRLVRAELRG